jgi:hypothetical protein
MTKTLINKDGEAWCPTCGTVLDGPKESGRTYPAAGHGKHGASCPDVAIDTRGNIRSAKYVDEAPTADEVA